MRRHAMPFALAALLAAPLTLGACASGRDHVQTYDAYYGDYHRWNRAELDFYRRWELETQRPHLDFDRRPVEERRAYFTWRHAR
jgi:hypothetical protein